MSISTPTWQLFLSRYDSRVRNCNHNFLAPPCQTSLEVSLTVEDEAGFDLPPSLDTEASDGAEADTELQYLVSPGSLYPCSKPGYFSEQTSCNNFFVCREITPGVLTAQRLFR